MPNWNPRFAAQKKAPKKEPSVKAATPIMSYFPTLKGEPRTERLRHYFHVDMATVLEMDPAVIAWTTETKEYSFSDKRGDITFKPDILASEGDRARAIRLLRAAELTQSRLAKYARLTPKLAELGITLEIFTDKQLAEDPRVRTAKQIHFHRYRDCREGLTMNVVEVFRRLRCATLGELHDSLGGDSSLWDELLSLVAKGFIIIDHSQGLSRDTAVRTAKLGGYCDE